MIEEIEGLPDGVIGVEAVGEIRAGDYDDVFEPLVRRALATHDAIRLIYVLGDEFEGYSGGAMWEDTKLGLGNWTKWEKLAIVTDDRAITDAARVFGWMVPGEFKLFPTSERDRAIEWVST